GGVPAADRFDHAVGVDGEEGVDVVGDEVGCDARRAGPRCVAYENADDFGVKAVRRLDGSGALAQQLEQRAADGAAAGERDADRALSGGAERRRRADAPAVGSRSSHYRTGSRLTTSGRGAAAGCGAGSSA